MAKKAKMINPYPAAKALAIWSALFMAVLWVLANMGIYVSAAEAMQNWHMFFDLSPMGLVGGAIEAAVVSVIGVYTFVYIYNMVASK